MRKAESLALGMSGLISAIATLFAPVVSFLTVSTNGILRLMGIDPNAEDEEVSEEEIRMLVDVGSEKGTIDHDEREFIQNVFEFDDLAAEELVTHRTDVTMLDLEDPMEVWKETIYSTRHTLYPICNGSVDKIVGILNAKDYFRLEDQGRESVMENAVSAAYFVPDTVKADILFRNMKKGRHALAVVLDEYGGMTGIITLNDLVEQLVGDLGGDDEEEDELQIEKLDEYTWKVHGSTLLEDLEEELNISLSTEEYDTFNGLIFNALGSIPEDGADIELEVAGLQVKVTEIVDHQVETAVIHLQPTEHNEEE